MKIYQLVAKGPLALAPEQVFRHSSREVFLDKNEAELFIPTFTAFMTQRQDVNDIAFLDPDPEKTKVRVMELTISGVIEQEDLGASAMEVELTKEVATPKKRTRKKAD